MNQKKLIKNHAKLNIVKRTENRFSLFSKYGDLNLDDDDGDGLNLFENVPDNLPGISNCELSSSDSRCVQKKIQKKKDIQRNIFAIRANSSDLKDRSRNSDKSKKSVKETGRNEAKRTLRTNSDLYASNISKILKGVDFDFIRFIIDQIGPSETYKLALEASNEERKRISDSLNNDNLNNGPSFNMIDHLAMSIINSKRIPNHKRQMILDYMIAHPVKKESTKRKKKFEKKMNTLNLDLNKLCLSTDKKKDEKKAKKFDFK